KAERHIGGGYALGRYQNVRLNIPVIHGEPFTGPAPTGHHLVSDEQDTVRVADLAEFGEILGGRNEHAIGADDRLGKDRRNVAFVGNHVLNIISAGYAAGRIGVLDGTFVAVHFGSEDEALALAGRFHGPATRVTGGSDRGGG